MRFRHTLKYAAIPLTFLFGACASSGANQPHRSSPEKITAAEIGESGATSAFDAVSRLRPAWLDPARLNMSGVKVSNQAVLVYLDGVRFGGTESLRSLNAATIASMEFLDATRAASRFPEVGSGPASAVILVRTR